MRTCWALVALPLLGCSVIGEEISEEFLNDKGIIVTVNNPLVTGEQSSGGLGDECTEYDNEDECDTDSWSVGEIACENLWQCGPGGPSQFLVWAHTEPGTGTVSIVAISGDLMKTVGTSVTVVPPDGSLPAPYCTNPLPLAPPYLIPTATDVRIKWDLELAGKRRYGDTGEVMVDAPGFTLVDYGIRLAFATFTTPATPGVYPVHAKPGTASFDYTVFDANAVTLDITPATWPSQAPNSIEYRVTGSIDGVQTCDDPGKKTITSETPAVCLLREWFSDEPTATVETIHRLYVTPQAIGTCRFTVTLGNSTVTRTFETDVEPIP